MGALTWSPPYHSPSCPLQPAMPSSALVNLASVLPGQLGNWPLAPCAMEQQASDTSSISSNFVTGSNRVACCVVDHGAVAGAGVDVPALFGRVGIEVGNTGERVGTFAIAYAAHKALSPVWNGPCPVRLHHACSPLAAGVQVLLLPTQVPTFDGSCETSRLPCRYGSHQQWRSHRLLPGYWARRQTMPLKHENISLGSCEKSLGKGLSL